MIKIKAFEFNPVSENTYVLYDETLEAVIIDAGNFDDSEHEELDAFIALNKLKVVALLNTHSHFDHVLGNYYVKNKYKVPLFIFKEDLETLLSVSTYAPNLGFFEYQEVTPDGYLHLDKPFKFGNSSLNILPTPGHAPGHIIFYNLDEKIAISGDNIMLNTIGRTDLPGGDAKVLAQTIKNVLFSLPDDTTLYPGHGGKTTVGHEKENNKVIQELFKYYL
ncbi:MAG: MBL fold metallo-hydrolase [Cytophagales bacterium]